MKEFLAKTTAGENLTEEEAEQVMDLIMTGKATDAQIAGFLVALKIKGETAEEVTGFVRSMRAHSVKISIDDPTAVDGCGTGGDGSNSFNISTAASIVAAGAGVTVAKHGNRAASSKCGSADLLEAVGGNIDPGPEIVRENINKTSFGFMFAPRFHPAMKHAIGPRREMGLRTVFNILGPMTNPASVKRQVIGVFAPKLMELMADVLGMTGSEKVLLVHSRDGLDEFSISAPTEYVELNGSKREVKEIGPDDVGLKNYPKDDLAGGDAARNVAILHSVLDGTEQAACREAVLFNAGAMIYVAEKAGSIAEGVNLARTAIDSGAAKEKLRLWINDSGC
jgi:anthranilate phosphoribosyltransferase